MAPFDISNTNFYRRSIVTMVLSCIISEIKRNIGRLSRVFHTVWIWRPRRCISIRFGKEKLELCGYRLMLKKVWEYFCLFRQNADTQRHGQIQTDTNTAQRHSIARQKWR